MNDEFFTDKTWFRDEYKCVFSNVIGIRHNCPSTFSSGLISQIEIF